MPASNERLYHQQCAPHAIGVTHCNSTAVNIEIFLSGASFVTAVNDPNSKGLFNSNKPLQSISNHDTVTIWGLRIRDHPPFHQVE